MTQINWNEVRREAPEWFRDAKFGLFFHWGPYSVPAYQNEWYSRNMYAKGLEQNRYHEEKYGKLHDFGYKDFYPMMTGSKFDAKEWAQLVKESGAKYAGPVSEHSDNFSLWDSKVNPVNSVNYGPKRDIVGECFEAFREEGIRTLATFHHQWLWGWFMSTDNEADVYDPANEIYYGPALPLETNRYLPYRYPDEKFCNIWRDKVWEVMEKYDPDAVYFDSRTCIIDEAHRYDIADYYYRTLGKQDGIITYKQEDFPEGIGVYDFERGQFADPKPFPWQSDDRLEDNVTWCMVQEPKYKSAKRIVHQLCDIVSKNGNLLLNVGPYADGSFHPEAVRILREIGAWLALNGEAIYGSRPFAVAAEGPTAVADTEYDVEKIKKQVIQGDEAGMEEGTFSSRDYRFTTKGDTLYAIAMGWPADGKFRIRSLRRGGSLEREIRSVRMIGVDQELKFTRKEEELIIEAPAQKPCELAYVLKVE
ncbi:MAG: alpha-L-fucosidase [Eubacteriales bacterium]|nr:alpha-L-fucosidase [Eubacteriales bacterium]